MMFRRVFRRNAPQNASRQAAEYTSKSVDSIEEGRRYRKDVPYALPRDLEEGQRLNLQHYLFRYMLRGNYVAPLPENISAILDVGSGTGIWGQEMARLFPSARVFGLDIEPPRSLSLAAAAASPPTNYHFVQGDLLQGLPFPEHTFDYTHQRMLTMAIPVARWPALLQELIRVTRPGGWLELLEIGETYQTPPGPASAQLGGWLSSMLAVRGMSMDIGLRMSKMLASAGLATIQSQVIDIPLGSWDRHLGVLMEKDTLAVFETLKPKICHDERLTSEQFEQIIAQAREEWRQTKATSRFHLVYAQV